MKKLSTDNINRAWDKLINTAVTTNTQKSFNVCLPLNVDGETWEAYGVEVSNRDILFFCKQGTATYLVDSYGEKHITELFNWEKNIDHDFCPFCKSDNISNEDETEQLTCHDCSKQF